MAAGRSATPSRDHLHYHLHLTTPLLLPLQATKNMTLTKLILRRNELTRIGADFFFEVLERRPNLSRRITIELFQNKEIPKGLAENVARAVSTKAPTAGGGSAASSAYTTE